MIRREPEEGAAAPARWGILNREVGRRRRVLKFDEGRRSAAHSLAESSDRLTLSGEIDGRNAETRAAQLRQALYSEQADQDNL